MASAPLGSWLFGALLVVASAATAAHAQLATATYVLGCDPSIPYLAPSVTGMLDAGNPTVTGANSYGTASCDATISIGDPILGSGPIVVMDVPSFGLSVNFPASLTYEYAVTTNPGFPGNPAGLMVPISLSGTAQASAVQGMEFVSTFAQAAIRGTHFGGLIFSGSGIEASVDATGTCLTGQPGLVNNVAGCVDSRTKNAMVDPGSTGQILLLTSNSNAGSALGGYSSFASADPVVFIDPDAEFEPGLRYADFFTIDVSPGVVNTVPEPSALPTANSVLAALALLRRPLGRTRRRRRGRSTLVKSQTTGRPRSPGSPATRSPARTNPPTGPSMSRAVR